MMFSVLFMCCECMDVLLLTRVQPSQQATALWDSKFTASKDALCIEPSALEMSVNANICEPCPSCWVVIYIDVVDASSSNRLSVSLMCRFGGIIHRHARPLLM